MRKYILIGIGGFIGAVLRFAMRLIELPISTGAVPINTLAINITGSLLLGFFLTVSADALKLKEEEKLGITTGFLGAFTTFSAVSKEVALKLADGSFAVAALYLMISVVLGLIAVFIGIKLGERLMLALKEARD